MTRKRTLGRTCACGVSIFDESKTGRCRPCNLAIMNHDPAMNAHRAAVLRHKLATDPAFKATKIRALTLARKAAREKPEFMAFLAASGERLKSYRTPEMEARRIAALVESNRRRVYNPWLPAEYKAEYTRLRKIKNIPAGEAKAIILAQIAADKKRVEDSLTPFERQDRALRRGGSIVANDRIRARDDMPGHSPFEVRAA